MHLAALKLPHDIPSPAGTHRANSAKSLRDLCTDIARHRAHAASESNGEEADFASACYPTNFTKGLAHNNFGLVAQAEDYRVFVEAINSPAPGLFDSHVKSAEDREVAFKCRVKGAKPKWRGWESPRAGHVYELQGPDAGSLGMAPAPRVGSSELSAEMAEVYAMALLRDVPFKDICAGKSKEKFCEKDGDAAFSGTEIANLLNSIGLNQYERNRRFARTQEDTAPYVAPLSAQTLFRGSTPGALVGPYISQFMLIGARSIAGDGNGQSNFPAKEAAFDLNDGFIPYGSLIIDQRTISHKGCLDHMTNWAHWLDVQNGANLAKTDCWEPERRFITTPRDLATYVHFDALYEAYLNAALILIAMESPPSKGFPERSPSGRRTPFATFGGPHILSLVTEVATRCLKAVRRQKFNYHRRARPEVMGARLTLAEYIRQAIIEHNESQNRPDMVEMRAKCGLTCNDLHAFEGYDPKCNLLLPMAFPEGSPMHPAYGAGHATVAGGCVTILKAFFEMFEDCDAGKERELCDSKGMPIAFVPTSDGTKLMKDAKTKEPLTIQGELDKLAANISIGRNMAGVHYYSDYYDSLRMGERVAVGILLEQAPTYGDPVEMTFRSFDGDLIRVSGQAESAPTLTILDRNGSRVSVDDWWLRHVVGEEVIL
ncbi:vanadium-dependent bromoperoxidase, vBPO [Chondrus crispus]|uniref:Vanadium-dependent bromoperoxidase, vBPO n=1 Tax=Chondrus crispus TaxID=2769 RepID=R7Q9K8_CHOCR|nr:vanadium-dependent bromoperoxidase, vBPO [Chondrus crispus]CDF34463.1 vanadium-dependent bromoperoxidase, vBPO [Chondrus crispus]|eukprot:XP_005714282.1 vanadium-dependent bromoperoxidase, vBPO [Chondrus crispus]